VTSVSASTTGLAHSPTLSSHSRSDDDESDVVEEDQGPRVQISLVPEEVTISKGSGLEKTGQKVIGPATEYGGSQSFDGSPPMPESVFSQGLSPTSSVFIPAGEIPIAESSAVMSTVLSPTGPVFIPAEQIPIPANGHTYSRGLSATAPIFVPSVPNNVPYLLCVADTSRSVRRQGCLNQSLEQIDIVRQVEMDARRKHFEYVVDWMWSPNSDLLVSTDRT